MATPTQTGSRFARRTLKGKGVAAESEQRELRCKNCRRILARGEIKDARLEIKCRCNYVNRFVFPKEVSLAISAAQ